MSASLLSGGAAPSSVVPTDATGGLLVQGLALEQTQGVIPTSVDVLTNCVWTESAFPQLANAAIPGQAIYQLGVQNGNGGGWNEGHLQLFGLSGATADNLLLDVPKQSPVANSGTQCVQLTGAAQSGTATVASGQTVIVVANLSITAASIILWSVQPYVTVAGPPAVYGQATLTLQAGASFTLTLTAAPAVGQAVPINYFIVKY